MERRAFLQCLCIGLAAAATPAQAVSLLSPLTPNGSAARPALDPGVATTDDLARTPVENAYYGHWRRVGRRHYRRVYRRRHY